MKAITDKIIEKLQSFIVDPNSEFGKGIQQSINVIKWEEKQAEFEEGKRSVGQVMDYVPD